MTHTLLLRLVARRFASSLSGVQKQVQLVSSDTDVPCASRCEYALTSTFEVVDKAVSEKCGMIVVMGPHGSFVTRRLLDAFDKRRERHKYCGSCRFGRRRAYIEET